MPSSSPWRSPAPRPRPRHWLHWWLPAAVAAVAAVELGGVVLSQHADERRRIGERAIAARLLSLAFAAGAVAVNWFGHATTSPGQAAFFAGMSAFGYAVWLIHSGARRRDQLRAVHKLPEVPPAYPLTQWLRHPWLTRRARGLALAGTSLGLYGSLNAARAQVRAERRQAAIARVLHRKIEASADATTAEIAVTVFDLDEIAHRLAAGADYDGLTRLLAVDLDPARLLGEEHTEPAAAGTPDANTEPGTVRPLPALMPAPVPFAALADVRRELWGATPTGAEPVAANTAEQTSTSSTRSPRTPGRRSPNKRTGGKRRSPGRSADETRTLAARLRTEHPGVTQAEVAKLLGISATRLRTIERAAAGPVNGVEVRTT